MFYRLNQGMQDGHVDDGLDETPMLFMLNCYDVWSATPKSATAFDCVAGSDAPTD